MAAARIAEDRNFRCAHVYCKGTTGMEFTAGGRIRGAWNIAFQYDPLPLQLRYRHRNG
ncbi:hypothetical protein D3C86_2063840 [compost metagenome]